MLSDRRTVYYLKVSRKVTGLIRIYMQKQRTFTPTIKPVLKGQWINNMNILVTYTNHSLNDYWCHVGFVMEKNLFFLGKCCDIYCPFILFYFLYSILSVFEIIMFLH